MKPAILKMNMMLLSCIILVTMANAQGPSAIDNNSKQASGKFTGHWYVKSGDEFFLVRSGNLPPGLVKKTSDNKVEDIDVESVKRAVNFRKESHFNGKPIDNYYFVIEEEGDNSTALYTPAAMDTKKNDNNSITETDPSPLSINKKVDKSNDGSYTLADANALIDYRICAIYACMGVNTLLYNSGCGIWSTTGGCGQSTSNVCIAYQPGRPAIAPYYYYVICDTTN